MNLVDQHDRDCALEVPCPAPPLGCSAAAGQPCVVVRTGEPLARFAAHTARLKAAGVVHAPLTADELRDPEARRGGVRW